MPMQNAKEAGLDGVVCSPLEAGLVKEACGAAFQTARCAVTYRKSTAVEITDMDAVVKWCMDNGYDGKITFAQPTVSKTDIAPLLKSGVSVTGAELCEKLNMGVK